MMNIIQLTVSNFGSNNFAKAKRYITTLLVVVGFIFSPRGNAYAQKGPKDKLLTNKNFVVEFSEVSKKKKSKTIPDEISFKSEKLNSPFMTKENNFLACPYTASIDSAADVSIINFQAELKNKDEETITWTGSYNGETIEGTATITDKKGKTKKEYTLTGTLKSKKKK